MAAGVLDLIGVLFVGVLGVAAAASLQGTGMPPLAQSALEGVGLGGRSPEAIAGICAVAAAVFLLTKSAVSAYLMRRVFRFLGNRQAQVSTELTERLLSLPLLDIERKSSQERAYALSGAVVAAVTMTLGSFALLLSEIALLVLLTVALLVINPTVTIVALVFFSLVGLGLQRSLRAWSTRIGAEIGATSVLGQQHLQEAVGAYREVTVVGRRSLYVDSISRLWRRGGTAQADFLFIMQVPKIGYETALVVGSIGLAGWQFATVPPVEATATLALFFAAGTRVLPSMLRLSSLVLGIRNGTAQARVLFPMMQELESAGSSSVVRVQARDLMDLAVAGYPGFTPSVDVERVGLVYPGASAASLTGIDLSIPAGCSLAIVGSTGSGKSSLADVILGVTEPTTGHVRISGLSVGDAIAQWPGAIAYVPQSVAQINGTVRDNVAIAFPEGDVDDDRVWAALKQAHLADFLMEAREGLDTLIGERGVRLSGGQRQRLGLARALYSAPKLLVLDEATSALDAETEVLVADAIGSLNRDVTTITIAHRLATIRDADIVAYLDDGRIVAKGTFDEVRHSNDDFNRQVDLLGLG